MRIDWKNAPPEQTVCFCNEVRKKDIARAVADGARTLEEVIEATRAGLGGDCAARNPSGRCCRGDILMLLKACLDETGTGGK